ncbi:hypothetical protein ACKLNR_009999 [Fusarium oxysporum f. sp. zingiberi]
MPIATPGDQPRTGASHRDPTGEVLLVEPASKRGRCQMQEQPHVQFHSKFHIFLLHARRKQQITMKDGDKSKIPPPMVPKDNRE